MISYPQWVAPQPIDFTGNFRGGFDVGQRLGQEEATRGALGKLDEYLRAATPAARPGAGLLPSIGAAFSPPGPAVSQPQDIVGMSHAAAANAVDPALAGALGDRFSNAPQQAPSNPAQQALNFFVERGYAPHQAAGIVGNLMHESGLNTGAINPGDGSDGSDSIGIAQWNGPRAQALRAFAAQNGGDPSDLMTQLAFVDHELNSTEGAARARLLQAQDPIQATAAFLGYERPQGYSAENPYGSHGWGNRAQYAAQFAGGNFDTALEAANAMAGSRPPTGAMPGAQRLPAGTLPPRDVMQALFASAETRPLAIQLAQAAQTGTQPPRYSQFSRNDGSVWQLDNQTGAMEAIMTPAQAAAASGQPDVSLTPQWGQDENGNWVMLQTASDGNLVQSAVPDGVTLVDPRSLAGERAAGAAGGKAQGEALAAAPGDIASATLALDIINQIRTHPELRWATGFSAGVGGNAVPGTGRFDFQNLVDQAKSGAFLTAVQEMRGLGALSNAEGGAATQAITRMNTATTTEGFLKALADYERVVAGGLDRARARLSSQQGSAPSAGGGYTILGVE